MAYPRESFSGECNHSQEIFGIVIGVIEVEHPIFLLRYAETERNGGLASLNVPYKADSMMSQRAFVVVIKIFLSLKCSVRSSWTTFAPIRCFTVIPINKQRLISQLFQHMSNFLAFTSSLDGNEG